MTPLVLGAALLLSGPSLVGAFRGTTDVDTALLHLVLALLVSAVAGRILRTLYENYRASTVAAARVAAHEEAVAAAQKAAEEHRRRTDG
ncbi:hypothetical protein ACFFKU_11855 [Kineococcus gynurae]|uniref:Uncharacterized protein n=1 Tax=Kineococcus gynurae TaxID=452979 RepID=A0ABV5LR71_9ACTN